MCLRTFLLSVVSLSAVASCDSFDPLIALEDFDEYQESTWVHSQSLDSSDSEPALVFGGSTGDLRYFSAAGTSFITQTVFSAAWKPDENEIDVRESNGISTAPFSADTATAGDPEHFAEGGNVAIGILNDAGAHLFMTSAKDANPARLLDVGGDAAPTGIAFGPTDASGQTDLVATAGDTVSLYPDYQQALVNPAGATDLVRSCSLGDPGQGIMVLDVDAAVGSEVLIATDGAISVTSGSTLVAAAEANQACFTTTPAIASIAAPGGEADFGAKIIAGDLDGTGSADLVVTAPSSNSVYVYLNWTTAAPTAAVKVDTPPQAISFGKSVVIGDFDDDGSNELLIGDPSHLVAAHTGAGSVYFYKADDDFSPDYRVLHNAQAVTDQAYGQSLMVAKVGAEDVLVVGANGLVFTYFQASVGDKDIRD